MFKKQKEKQARKSLTQKLQALLAELAWIEGEWALERICDFFNTLDVALSKLTEVEKGVAPTPLLNVIRTTQRCGENGYGWFRFGPATQARPGNTFIVPTGHYDEVFRTLSVAELMQSSAVSDQGGFAKKPMADEEFYKACFVEPFVLDKYRALRSACGQLTGVAV